MYADTPWLGRSGLLERPTTAMVWERFNQSVIGSEWGKEAITAFYDNVISQSESLKFTIRQSIECGDEVANIGELRITLPGNQVGIVQLANIYKVNSEGKLVSLRSFWEQDKLEFTPG